MPSIPRTLIAAALLFLCIAAAPVYWDPAQSKTTPGSGGDGHWYPNSVAWYSPAAPAADQAWTPGANAVFAASPGSVILNSAKYGGLTADSLTFTRGDYFLENINYTGAATHRIGTFTLGSGLFTYHCDYHGVTNGDVWNVSALKPAQGAAMMFYVNNLGLYKGDDHSLFSIANRSALGLVGAGSPFATGRPNFDVSIVPYIVYAKYLHLPYYTFVGYDTANNSLRPLIGGQENNSQQCPVLDYTTRPTDNVRLAASASLIGPRTINSLVFDGCGYVPSTADITGTGTLTITSGGLLFLCAPENFSNPVVFPPGVEGHVFIANGRVWANAGSFSPTLRSSFSGDHGLTITGQPDYTYDPASDSVAPHYNPDPVTLAGDSTYTGVTTINAARVVTHAPSNFGSSSVIVLNAGAVLAPVSDNFLSRSQSLTMNPGSELDAPGRVTTLKDFVLNPGSIGVALHSSTTLKPSGALRINGATLKLVLDSAPTDGQKFTLISNPPARPVLGSFADLPQGASIQASYNNAPFTLAISYIGGRGHDVVLSVGAGSAPEAAATAGTPAAPAAAPSAAPVVPATAPPSITSSIRYSSMLGTPFYFRITATNHPTNFEATGLPPGLTLNSTTGVISGATPSTQGAASIALKATNALGSATGTLALTVLGASVYHGPTTETPYLGTPFAVPGQFFCVNYDLGGPGVAYNDEDVGNHYVPEGCAWYRNPHDDVDIPDKIHDQVTQGGFILGVHGCGGIEWEKYTINVTKAGTYNIEFREACMNAPGHVHFEIDDVDVTGTIAEAITGGWNNFTTISTPAGYISAGRHVVKLCQDWDGDPHDGGASFNWINFVLTGEGRPPKR